MTSEAGLDQACIIGIGETTHARNPGSGLSDTALILQGVISAIDDARIQSSEVDGLMTPYINATAEDLIANLGLKHVRFSSQVNMGGASPVASLEVAAMAVEAGLANFVIVPYGWNGFSGVRARAGASHSSVTTFRRTVRDYYMPYGTTAPPQVYALIARRYVEEYDPPSAGIGSLAVTIRRHAQTNQIAVMKDRPMTLQDYLKSRLVVDPFRLYDCCLETDSAAAVVVSTLRAAAKIGHQRPITIEAVAAARPTPPDDICNRKSILDIGLADAAPAAFEKASVGPHEIDFVEVYDCFTHIALLQLEAAGFAAPGESPGMALDGAFALGGRLPTNTHGGLLSQGHGLGMNHIVEAVRQLRLDAGAGQVPGARRGVVTGWGDLGDGSIAILARR